MTQENAGAGAVLGAAAALGGPIGAAVGLLGRATAALDSLGGQSTQKFEVNRGTILKAGLAIHDQAKRLESKLVEVNRDLLIPANTSVDGRVGADIAGAWNSRLMGSPDTYAGRVESYIKSLKGLSDQLREAAKQYDFTEEEITTTFGPKA